MQRAYSLLRCNPKGKNLRVCSKTRTLTLTFKERRTKYLTCPVCCTHRNVSPRATKHLSAQTLPWNLAVGGLTYLWHVGVFRPGNQDRSASTTRPDSCSNGNPNKTRVGDRSPYAILNPCSPPFKPPRRPQILSP